MSDSLQDQYGKAGGQVRVVDIGPSMNADFAERTNVLKMMRQITGKTHFEIIRQAIR